MKSGLKARVGSFSWYARIVATYAAMKSGLKEYHDPIAGEIDHAGSNLCRDEKRTESTL